MNNVKPRRCRQVRCTRFVGGHQHKSTPPTLHSAPALAPTKEPRHPEMLPSVGVTRLVEPSSWHPSRRQIPTRDRMCSEDMCVLPPIRSPPLVKRSGIGIRLQRLVRLSRHSNRRKPLVSHLLPPMFYRDFSQLSRLINGPEIAGTCFSAPSCVRHRGCSVNGQRWVVKNDRMRRTTSAAMPGPWRANEIETTSRHWLACLFTRGGHRKLKLFRIISCADLESRSALARYAMSTPRPSGRITR